MHSRWRYGYAFVGGFLAMAAHIYWLYGRGNWLAPQRLSATIGNALIFGHLLAAVVLLGRDLAIRPTWLRYFVRMLTATAIGAVTWYAHVYLFLFQTNPHVPTLLAGGFGLAIGFVLSGLRSTQKHRIGWLMVTLLTAACIYLPVYLTHQSHLANTASQALLYFQADNPDDVFRIGLPFAIVIAFFGNLPLLLNSSQRATR